MKKMIAFTAITVILFSSCSNSNAPKSTTDEIPPEYAQITAIDGKNVMGSTAANLSTGGFITHQGEWVYYADFNNHGNLYAAKKDGKDAVMLTDFPVANINIAGDVLAFTDISFCEYYKDGGYSLAKNKSYDELFALVNSPGQLKLGGSLYMIYKPLEDKEPKMKILTADNETYYEGVILTQNVLSYMAVSYTKDMQIIPTAAKNDNTANIQAASFLSVTLPISKSIQLSNLEAKPMNQEQEADWFGDPIPSLRDALQMNTEDTNSWRRWAAPIEGGMVAGQPVYAGDDSLYVTVFTADGKSYIYRYNINKKSFVSAVEGHSLATNGKGDVFFLDPDGYVYKYDTSSDDSGEHKLVPGVRADHLTSTTGKDVMLSYKTNDEWFVGKITTDHTSPEEWYAAPSKDVHERVPWSWKSGDITMNYDFKGKALYMSEFNKAWKAQDNKNSKPTAKKYQMSELSPQDLSTITTVRDDMVVSSKEQVDTTPAEQESTTEKPLENGNDIVLERVDGTGTIFDNNKKSFPVKVGEKVGLTYRISMDNESLSILNMDGVNRLAILSSKASVLSNNKETVVSMPGGLNMLIGNPSEDKPFEVLLENYMIKSKGGLIVAHDSVYPTFMLYKGDADLYDKNGNLLATLNEGYRYEINTDGKPNEGIEINYRFTNFHGKSNYPLVVDLARSEAYLKAYFDAKNEEYIDKY